MKLQAKSNRTLLQSWLFITSGLLLLLSLILTLLVPTSISPSWIRLSVFISVGILIFHFLGHYLIGHRDFLSFDKLFLASYALFHLGYLFLYSLNLVPYDGWVFFDPKIVNLSVIIICLYLSAFVFGFNLVPLPHLEKIKTVAITEENLNNWFLLGKAILLVGLALIGYFVITIGPETLINRAYGFSFFYSGDYSTRGFTGGRLLVSLGFTIFLLESLTKKRWSLSVIFIYLLLVPYTVLLLLFGVRSWIILDLILPFLITYHYFSRKITLKIGGLLLLIFLFFSIFLELGRPAPNRSFSEFVSTVTSQIQSEPPNLLELTARLGTAYKNVTREMSLIPNIEPYYLGKTYVGSIITSIPIVGNFLKPDWYEQPDRWLARHTDPWYYRNFEGIGFSVIAEAHMNFGIYGGAIILFLLGLFARYFYTFLFKIKSPFYWFLYISIFSNSLFAVRQTISDIFRPIWGILILWAAVTLIKWVQSKHGTTNLSTHIVQEKTFSQV